MAFDARAEHFTNLIYMQNARVAPANTAQAAIYMIALSGDWLTVLCHDATPEAVETLAALPAQYAMARLAVFCPRPKALALLLAERGVDANAYSITEALLKGQAGRSAPAHSES